MAIELDQSPIFHALGSRFKDHPFSIIDLGYPGAALVVICVGCEYLSNLLHGQIVRIAKTAAHIKLAISPITSLRSGNFGSYP
jgi:hypothetical protein